MEVSLAGCYTPLAPTVRGDACRAVTVPRPRGDTPTAPFYQWSERGATRPAVSPPTPSRSSPLPADDPAALRASNLRPVPAARARLPSASLPPAPRPSPTFPPTPPADLGAIGMPDPHSGSLLVFYFETYLRDQNVEAFAQVSVVTWKARSCAWRRPRTLRRAGGDLRPRVWSAPTRPTRRSQSRSATRRDGPESCRERPVGHLVQGRHAGEQRPAREGQPPDLPAGLSQGRPGGDQSDRGFPSLRRP